MSHPSVTRLSVSLILPLTLFAGLAPPATSPAAAATLIEAPVFDDEVRTTWRRVTWEDFKGRWRKLSKLTSEGAYIATGIHTTDWSTHPRPAADGTWIARPDGLAVYSFMEKHSSSYQPGSNTEYALAHEQGHFDLSEVVARRLSRRLVGVMGRGEDPRTASRDLQRQVNGVLKPPWRSWTASSSATTARPVTARARSSSGGGWKRFPGFWRMPGRS